MDPQSRIKALSAQGSLINVDSNIPLRRYFRSGNEMAKMAKIYEEEKSYENAYILYMRYITLFVEKIREHPEFTNHILKEKKATNMRLKEILPAAEKLKDFLREKYQKEFDEAVAHQKIIEEQLMREKLRKEKEREEKKRMEAIDVSGGAKSKDIWDHILITPYDKDNSSQTPTLNSLVYPTDSLSSDRSSDLPVKPLEIPDIPSRDLKPLTEKFEDSVPIIDRDTKPLSLLSAHLDKGSTGLRKVIVPEDLLGKFLSLAYSNTSLNIETCGILAGKMTKNTFMITHLLVPQQVGTPDSCTTQHEEELFDQQDKYDLITLGWIHTHPTQTAFLSSVDLHTHCSYQLMMPEAVAIVCAPKFKETGYFTLTQNHGLSFIANCRQSGFHPHPSEPPLFKTAEHIILDSSLPINIVDLRS